MKRTITKPLERPFSRLSAVISFLLAFYGWFILYVNSSLLWILSGFNLVFTLIAILIGTKNLKIYLTIPVYKNIAFKAIRYLSIILFFLTSAYGLINVIMYIPGNDKSIFLLPLVALLLILSGSAIGIYQDDS